MEMNNLAEMRSNDPLFLELKNKLLEWNRNTAWLTDENGHVPEWGS